MTTKEKIEAKARKAKEMGSPMSIDQLIIFFTKKEAKNIKKMEKYNRKNNERKIFENHIKNAEIKFNSMTTGEFDTYADEYKRKAFANQSPSSMR